MAYWLVKGDPGDYGAPQLERDGKTFWTGVKNPQAQNNLRAMAPDDQVLVYHTGDQKAIVAQARVLRNGGPDPKDKTGKSPLVEIKFSGWLKKPVALSAIKADKRFADFLLVRNSRLSVMPVSDVEWAALLKLAN